jgi:hypothetical protein
MGHPLRQPTRVDEHQRAAVRLNQFGQSAVGLGPLFVRADGGQFAGRDLDAQVELPQVPDVQHRAIRLAVGPDVFHADQEAGNVVDGPLRGRQADPHRRQFAECLEPFQRQRQVRASLIASQGVDFVDDHRIHAAQRLAALGRSE